MVSVSNMEEQTDNKKSKEPDYDNKDGMNYKSNKKTEHYTEKR
jgi:hypothetical protein